MDSPASLNVKSGENTALEVTVCGSPELKIKWFKDNKELSAGAKYQISFAKKVAILKIRSADKADAGEYKLEVTNHVGTASCQTQLSVSGWCSAPDRSCAPSVAGFSNAAQSTCTKVVLFLL